MLQKLKKNSEPEVQSSVYNYKCGYCGKTFVHETRYINHHCEEMKRHETLETTLGQAAYSFYEFWHKTCKRIVPPVSTFLASTVFTSFITFAKFVKQVKMPNPKTFIRLMIEKKIQPSLWTHDDVYVMFLEYTDNNPDPKDHITTTIKTICDVCEKTDMEVKDFFNVLTPNEIAQLIRQRRLSPWVLLNSNSFKRAFLNMNTDEQRLIENVIRPDFWKKKFLSNPEGVAKVKKYICELGI